MNKIITILLILLTISLTGCNYYSYDFNATSNSDCMFQCTILMKEHHCMTSSPTLENSFLNGQQTTGKCSCFVDNCYE